MSRTDRNNAIRFESLEEALAKDPETYGHIDLLCAGWPCQGNSIAGSRKGMQDERSGLWQDVARCLRLFKPKWFLGENVPGILSVNDGRDFRQVLSDLMEIGYGVAWRILNSQHFGVAQRRRRIFFVGCFGEPCPPEILFEREGGARNDPPKQEMGQGGLCISTRDGERQDPTSETFIAATIRANDYRCGHRGFEKSNIITTTVRTVEPRNRIQGHVAQTLGATRRGDTSFIWQDTHIAETNPDRERETSGTTGKLDSVRGVVIGNAVTVNVAEWIGKQIINAIKTTEESTHGN